MRKNVLHVAGLLVTVGLLGYTHYHSQTLRNSLKSSLTTLKRGHSAWESYETVDISNHTLGFQKVFVISSKARTDRQDAITLQASVSDLDVTFVNAAIGSDVSELALPYTMNRTSNEVGRWRSHLDVMRHIVENNVQTALILEDDADWDVSLHAQMQEAARGFRYILNDQGNTLSPYGDHWDLLWIGYTDIAVREHPHASADIDRRWVIPRDPTVAPRRTRSTGFEPSMKEWDTDPQTRIMFLSGRGRGSTAWAVSMLGAEKALYRMSLVPYDGQSDSGMSELCSSKSSDMTCLAAFPPIIGVSKPAGSASGDHNTAVDKEHVLQEAVSESTVFSTRLNLIRILNEESHFLSSNPNVTGEFLTLQEITKARGSGWQVNEQPNVAARAKNTFK